ncbi:TPA: Sec-independent protein translocase subunit TatB [Mannheimia haemolytica]|uniref:Sec-independent protein translocase protein TatB n=1 Tax=Mannheimia haemolytica TaxID=75985 RepID=A0A248ZY60_MANHA|nr:Sec-independent protein translocase protein TatB [Mannheimia haemolytica]AWW70593.1 twin-arginine translocase subunit TatB [Pasteurellaceae bacterium 12565]AGI31656.1 twin-arginine translocase subunit TatB [Mannheimia haemolytica USDA-ARS-USMARC-183]AGI36235.1 twin-arginine translocase subunit TatB [Mannheimia haemolytica USDA-ARS-USMARC-185]AGK00705.1 twin arginine-targeting protein translocase TatB [Mannheimia haemolytica M42548]AGQ25561.1 preprotein translocase subunit TatB [Mannheimia h
MFDIGFSELVLIMIVGLVVLGPKRMPIAIRTVMGWVSTIRGLAANVQNELAQELKLQELKESIKKAEELNLSSLSPELNKTVEDLKMSATQLQDSLNSAKNELEKTAAESSTIPKLTDEQVAEIQQKIEQESQVLEAQELQKNAQNKPLEVDSLSEQLNVTRTEKPLSADELAEQAEMDESLLTLESYYPPDDDLATPQSSESAQKSEANNVAS